MIEAIDAATAQNRAALIGYLPVGYPSVDASCRAIAAMVEAGVDGVEVGLPYSDPSMDGPTVQAAAEAALQRGVRVKDVFAGVRAAVEAGAPAVVMSYYNPILQYGIDRFAAELAEAGGAGVILPDLTPDNADEWLAAATAHGLETTFLVAPSSTQERIHYTVAATTGFLYATAVMGVTGERAQIGTQAERLVRDSRASGATHVCVGIGVTTGEHAATVGAYADGVIVGSALVRTLLDHENEDVALAALRAKVSELAQGVRSAR
ncbi:tryptophan synthase subunit alpha [Demequina sp.]|uniref:tryptophan synthase subunit alpha n=1 Tax=Demequina sp. TaxID=2050685 RepID=UPI003D0A09B5